LTVADMSMVAPGNLTGWKEQLLRELYVRTLAFYRRGPDLLGSERGALIERRKKRVAELLGESEAALASWFASLPDRYVTLTTPRQMVSHISLSRRRGGPVAMDVVHRPHKAISELAICADDAPGLLCKIAGVLLANRVDVLQAQIHTRRATSRGAAFVEALDTFTTRDRHGRLSADGARWQRIEEDLGRVLNGAVSIEQLIDERRERSRLPERVVPRVRTEIHVDDEVSTEFSVIDVYTHDRLGVLYTIARTIAELQLDIQLSKVATEASRVADVFYVREQSGEKLDVDRIEEVKLVLAEALGHLQAHS
jgi:[protein-PII] uridylyltransferase